MAFGARDSFPLRVDPMSEFVVVSLAHLRWRILVAGSRMAFATTRSAYFLTRLHLFGRLVANVALSMTGKTCARAGHRMTARAIGPLLTALISRVSFVGKLDSERLPLGKVYDRWLHRRYALVTI
jgi:hypothetical protein